jgi:hypothetical protein
MIEKECRPNEGLQGEQPNKEFTESYSKGCLMDRHTIGDISRKLAFDSTF